VPTWNYVALELAGPVRQMDEDGMSGLLETIGARQEGRIAAGEPWRPEEVDPGYWNQLARGILGFELEIRAWRPTFKLSQNKSVEDRAAIAEALEAQGSPALASLIRTLAK
jgi:transcriptional regulator